MDLPDALDFLRTNHRAVLATRRRSGDPQLSPVLAVADEAGRVLVSTRETAMKTRNLRRDPRASLLVLPDAFFGAWVQLTGPVEIVSLPEAMDLLIDYYRRAGGEHENWDDYRAAMIGEQRCVVVLTPEQAGPTVAG
ncbi:TIGR03618 family F420-dependent PPOX class oxidoreductase [Pseudactinotalea sp. HY160]|uniref:PPOX class F420-dependent oxidoreductase n=1 Tax=Pseudactinotalea sp. HY160 TaxID=2654490 RepID=UPI00128C5A60|nr:PPOX class F420-dependent oxidoreductase [Pseudactinotalea sp. HY160]MPV49126.1 TIGR03618 family F420-dependent PPOX class oxidoreductase [Pseudactinotalea sp. HY160]